MDEDEADPEGTKPLTRNRRQLSANGRCADAGVAAAAEMEGPEDNREAMLSLAQHVAEQLVRHHGCSQHDIFRPSDQATGLSMSDVMSTEEPQVLSSATIRPHPADWEERFPVALRRRLFTGIRQRPVHRSSPPDDDPAPFNDEDAPPMTEDILPARLEVGLDSVDDPTVTLVVTFDVDSAGGFATSLAVARKGLHWLAVRPPVSNLTASLHLPPVRVGFYDDTAQRWRTGRAPVHRVPHLPLGRLHGLESAEAYVLFPRLYHPKLHHWVITDDQWGTWTDEIVMPAIYDCGPAETVQHFTAGARDAQCRATATSIELPTQGREGPRMKLLHHFIQAQHSGPLWNRIQFYIQRRRHAEFEQCLILITAKNLKTNSQDSVLERALEKFFNQWDGAVDRSLLADDFYDVGKESFSFLRAVDVGQSPLTLTWRRCCLESFRNWLGDMARDLVQGQSSSAMDGDQPENTAAPTRRELRPRRQPHRTAQVVIPNRDPQMDDEDGDGTDDASVASPRSPTSSSAASPGRSSVEPTLTEAPPPLREEFYPVSLTQDMGSLTIEPHVGRESALRRHGLLYAQLYNTSKGIFAAGSTYPFANHALDTLALDAGLVRSWQHIGQAVSHSPQAILRAYVHAKTRCHTALSSYGNNSYGTCEEYRVKGFLLREVNRIMTARAEPRETMPMENEKPFFVHSTETFLSWIRWNLNRLCLGFELVYTLQPHTVVHWEHTRVMMMFLRALMYIYGGQGHHMKQSNGLWLDRRVRVGGGGSGSGGREVTEGMGIGQTIERYGYGWLLDKVDWSAMVFRVANRDHMAFNSPALLSAYTRRYQPVVRSQRDYIFVHDIFSELHAAREGPAERAGVLLDLLVNVCLRAFRKDVFEALRSICHIRIREGKVGYMISLLKSSARRKRRTYLTIFGSLAIDASQ